MKKIEQYEADIEAAKEEGRQQVIDQMKQFLSANAGALYVQGNDAGANALRDTLRFAKTLEEK